MSEHDIQHTDPTANPSDGLSPTVLNRLIDEGWKFDFFQAVRIIERFTRDRESVGRRGPVANEAIRFRPHISLGFPSTDVRKITKCYDPEKDQHYYLIDVTFFGLYGVSTPLPLHYAIDMLRAVSRDAEAEETSDKAPGSRRVERQTDTSHTGIPDASPARDFLDILHHRMISLFYRAGTKYRYATTYGQHDRDEITNYLRLFIGSPRLISQSQAFTPPTVPQAFTPPQVSTDAQMPHPGTPPESVDPEKGTWGLSPNRLLRYAGALTQKPRSATLLEGILEDYWDGILFHVEQFIGRWIPLDIRDMTRMESAAATSGISDSAGRSKSQTGGQTAKTTRPNAGRLVPRGCSASQDAWTPPAGVRLGSPNNRLGVDTIVGEQVYDLSGAFRIDIGPVDWKTYLTFLPDGEAFTETRSLVQLYTIDPLAYTMEVTLLAGEAKPMMLGVDPDMGRLGYTSWICTESPGEATVGFDSESLPPIPPPMMDAVGAG